MNDEFHIFGALPCGAGFGMSRHEGLVEAQIQAAARLVTRILRTGTMPEPTEETLGAFSVVKGMFNRIHRQDQWDWFTTNVRLGLPTGGRSESIGFALGDCRIAARDGDEEAWKSARERTRRLKVRRSLAVLTGHRALVDVAGHGFVYVMSNREDRDLLAVGVTDGPILEEAGRVNAVAGRTPLGVRAVWWVEDVDAARKVVAGLLDGLRREDDGRYEADFRWFRPAMHRALRDADLVIDPLGYLVRVDDRDTSPGAIAA